jgi:hypothetical protein
MKGWQIYIKRCMVSLLRTTVMVGRTSRSGSDQGANDMVAALKRCFSSLYARVTLQDKSPAETQCMYPPRPMTGFFASLTQEQQKAALEYRGEENHGDSDFSRVNR